MVVIDSGIWIDFFNGVITPATDRAVSLLRKRQVLVGDLIMTEVLQGFRTQRDFEAALQALTVPPLLRIADGPVAIQAAHNYGLLRQRGITIRKTIDTLIATRCIIDQHHLLYSDRDFDPFVAHLGLISAMDAA